MDTLRIGDVRGTAVAVEVAGHAVEVTDTPSSTVGSVPLRAPYALARFLHTD